MSDSDSTWPATDDFGSRFLEMDVYESEGPQSCPPSASRPPSKSNRRPPSSRDARPSRKNAESRPSRNKRVRSYAAMDEGIDDDEEEEYVHESTATESHPTHGTRSKRIRAPKYSDESEILMDSSDNFRAPKLLTARQMSLKMQQVASKMAVNKKDSMEPELLSLESIEPTKSTSIPTPEQLAARQLSITRRRESAKNKAELEKRQTVERLLKINTDSDNFQKRCKGRGRGPQPRLSHSASASSVLSSTASVDEAADTVESSSRLDAEEEDPAAAETTGLLEDESIDQDDDMECNREALVETLNSELASRIALGEKHGLDEYSLDPPVNFIRSVLSLRLSPPNRLCFPPPNHVVTDSVVEKLAMVSVEKMFCGLGCGRPRRYACSTTGVPLCSLMCYKENMVKHDNISSTLQSAS